MYDDEYKPVKVSLNKEFKGCISTIGLQGVRGGRMHITDLQKGNLSIDVDDLCAWSKEMTFDEMLELLRFALERLPTGTVISSTVLWPDDDVFDDGEIAKRQGFERLYLAACRSPLLIAYRPVVHEPTQCFEVHFELPENAEVPR